MRRIDLKSRTALVLSLGTFVLVPPPVAAQVTDPDTLGLFTPEVAACRQPAARL